MRIRSLRGRPDASSGLRRCLPSALVPSTPLRSHGTTGNALRRSNLLPGLLLACLMLLGLLGGCSGDTGGDDDASSPSGVDVRILAPAEGDHYAEAESIQFQGQASDASGDPIQLQWTSSIDGDLSTAASFSNSALSTGQHVITLVGTGGSGVQGSATVSITVESEGGNAAPSASISAPAEGTQVVQGQAVTFIGEAVDPEDGVLAGSSLLWSSDVDGLLGSGSPLTVSSLSTGAHIITLTAVDSSGQSDQASIGLEVFAIGQNVPPEATISQPPDGATYSVADSISLVGSAQDVEDGTIKGGGLSWASSRDGALGTGSPLTVTLSQGVHTLTLMATDSGGKTAEAQVTVSVNPADSHPPTMTILQPESGSSFVQGVVVTFQGKGADPEDGTLTDSALEWSSSLDGNLGIGETVTTTELSVGQHTIVLTGTDSSGAKATASIQIRVTGAIENQPPAAEITVPADGSSYKEGTSVTFKGQGIDAEDGPLSGPSLVWTSDRDGSLGSGATLITASLSAGVHHIRLTAVDSLAATGSDSITLTITAAPPQNKPPTALLTGPGMVVARTAGVFDASSSSDPDGSVVRYVFDFGDGSAVQDGSSPTASHVFEDSAVGPVTVTLTVYDDRGASSSSMLALQVTPFERTPVVAEDSHDVLASYCALGFLADGRAAIGYRDVTHPAFRFALEQEGGDFQLETVDGYGLDMGGDAGSSIDLVVDAEGGEEGLVHAAWLFKDSSGTFTLRYGQRSSAGWTVVTLDTASDVPTGRALALALDGSHRPMVLYRGSSQAAVRLATCQGDCGSVGGWTLEDAYTETRGTSSNLSWAGGLATDSSGGVGISVSTSYKDTSGSTKYALRYRHRPAGGSWKTVEDVLASGASSTDAGQSRLAFDASSQALVVYPGGTAHRLPGGWSLSKVEGNTLTYFAVTVRTSSDTAFLLNRHSGTLEIVAENTAHYWEQTELGPMDSAWPGIALDERGEPRACFARDGNLMLY